MNIRRIRAAKGISQEALSFDAGVHRVYLGGIECGTRNPSVTVVERIARGLGVSVDDLLAEPQTYDPPRLRGPQHPRGE